MNPYASFLGERDAREVIAATPQRLSALLETIGPYGAEAAPAPGKWNAREILCHLADCEMVFGYRLRQAVAEPYHVIQPFDQEKWAEVYGAYDARGALELFTAMRRWNITFIASLPQEMLAKKLTHPERGELAIRNVVETMGGHDINHLGQIEKIASHSAGA